MTTSPTTIITSTTTKIFCNSLFICRPPGMKYKNLSRMLAVISLFVLLGSSYGTSVKGSPDLVEIDLKQGKMQGVRHSLGESREYYSFRGIPYAQPPVGDLRFRDPVPAKSWHGLRKDVQPPSCPQAVVEVNLMDTKEFMGEEDCLYLNVYTPKPCKADLPVMVYIHGGGFKFGNSEFMGGTPHRLLKKDVVLVSIHYRLGTLGFLSTGDSVLPGNYGLKDQTLALRWVHDNIKEFGGDPERITIFGESAGGVSVHFQMLTPYAKGLFNRGIMQSGTALNPWGMRDDHAEIAIRIGTALGCLEKDSPHPSASSSVGKSTLLLSCLQKASVEELVTATTPFTKGGFPFLMVPRVDGDFIPAHPAQLLRDGEYHKTDLISGFTQNEAAGVVKSIMLSNQTSNADFVESFITHMLPMLSGMGLEANSHYLNQRAFYHYMNEHNINEENVDQFEKFLSESFMVMCQDEASAMHARDAMYGRRVYRYELQHRGRRSFTDWVNTSFGENWVAHLDDVQYLFDGVLGYPPVQHPQDVFMSDVMVSLWTNFASTGDPTPNLDLGFKWEAMTSPSDFRYLSLKPSPKMKEDYRGENRQFWRNMPIKRNELLFH